MTPQGKKVLGIIAEYNPLHNGHQYHINEARRLTGCDHVVVIMSGDFVQRGTPALLDKFTRARFALEAGADVVLELPVACACGSAEYFARGAVGILHALGIVDVLAFGCEDTDLTTLCQLSDILTEEPEEYQKELITLLRTGMNFPLARQQALASITSPHIAGLLSKPNNILAVEYLKAIKYFNSSIEPLGIQRIGMGYHDINGDGFASATAIREMVKDRTSTDVLKTQLPAFVWEHFKSDSLYPIWLDDFSSMLAYTLNHHNFSSDNKELFTQYQDVSSELSDRIRASLHDSYSFSEMVESIFTRGHTTSRLQRALMHIFLNITRKDMQLLDTLSYAPYARILGLRKQSSHILRSVSEDGSITLVTKIADAKTNLAPDALHFLYQDIHASELYNQIVYQKYNHKIPSDYFYRFPVK